MITKRSARYFRRVKAQKGSSLPVVVVPKERLAATIEDIKAIWKLVDNAQ